MSSTRFGRALVIGIVWIAVGCSSSPQAQSSKPAPAATVNNAVKEPELSTLTLTPDAERTAGIELVEVVMQSLPDYRTLSGEAMVPPTQSRTVVSPVAGTLMEAGATLEPGVSIRKTQQLFRLLPLDRESRGRDLRAEAERELRNAQAQLETAQSRVNRAEQLLRDGAGSQRNVEDAKLELSQAQAAEKAARDQLQYVTANPFDKPEGLLIEAPEDGILLKSYAGPGQVVSGGTALIDIARIDPLWIRVPVYAGEAVEFSKTPAVIHPLGRTPGVDAQRLKRVNGVPAANASAATVDFFYEVSNSPLKYRPGEKVGVSFVSGKTNALAVPWSAVIHDINGGTWIYANTAPHTYSRRRVELASVVNGTAALRRGPDAGTRIVKTGAAELFAAEFGVGK
jgi:cobalt-zinc-cadmium efflux system membrane fusion protein